MLALVDRLPGYRSSTQRQRNRAFFAFLVGALVTTAIFYWLGAIVGRTEPWSTIIFFGGYLVAPATGLGAYLIVLRMTARGPGDETASREDSGPAATGES